MRAARFGLIWVGLLGLTACDGVALDVDAPGAEEAFESSPEGSIPQAELDRPSSPAPEPEELPSGEPQTDAGEPVPPPPPPPPDAGVTPTPPPTCQAAGGNVCTTAGDSTCAGEAPLASSDCQVCCTKCNRSTPGNDLPVIHYYGFFASPTPNIPDEVLNRQLIVPGLEVIFSVANPLVFDPPGWHGPVNGDPRTGTDANYPTCAPYQPEFLKWRGHGAKLAKRITNEQLQAWLDDGTAADRLERILRYGWDYITIDEIGGVAWRDSGNYGPKGTALLKALAARGFDKKLLIWVNPSTTQINLDPAVNPTGAANLYKNFLAACRAHCKRIIWESYPQNSDNCPADWNKCVTTYSIVTRNTSRYIEYLATRLNNVAAGTNRFSLTGIGGGNTGTTTYLDLPQCDLAPNKGACTPSPTQGGLFKQFAQLHAGTYAREQCGVAIYGHARTSDTSVWQRADYVAYLKSLTSWWVGKSCLPR